ncbi:hypothetical protein COO60DRAFT_1672641 [Scenedesmus sp. NREL 46B-D3]|nr:hypothetical protein COO60DRAFT_1672641 [Scenedesmus sp. NREL 46B-D3]
MDAGAVLSGDAPVLAVRLTQLSGGGSILAVTASHVVLGLAAVSGLSGLPGQQGCASLTVLPLAGASSTAAEADESASLQPSISVTSTTSTVVSSCLSTHAASFREKPSWHGLQHPPAVSSSSPVALSSAAAAMAAVSAAETSVLVNRQQEQLQPQQPQQQQQQQAQKEHVQHKQSPATPTTPPATAAAPSHTQTAATPGVTPTHAQAAYPAAPKPFPYTPEPLYATGVLPNSWLGGFRAAAAAVAQVKAEQRHIKQALLQRQGLLPSTRASLCGFGGGNRAGCHMLSAAGAPAISRAAKDVAGNAAAGAAFAGKCSRDSSSGSSRVGAGGTKPVVDISSLSTQLLHIPQAALQQLKATASLYCQEGQYISSNDAVSSLVWLLMCYLRKRPLPGQARPPALQGEPAEDPTWRVPVAWHSCLNPVEWQLICSDAVLLAKSLAAGAVRIRGALQAVRGDDKFPAKMLQQVQDGCEAGLASQLAMGAGLVHRLDAFVTSWQFAIFDVAFGSSSSSSSSSSRDEHQQPLVFQGLVHPVPPYHAVVLPAPPAAVHAATPQAGGATAGEDAGGGVLCCLTVPQCLLRSMVESPVLQLLAPGARWLSPCGV